MEHLKKYKAIEFKVRLAPDVMAKLYKNGRFARVELEMFVESKGFRKCHAAQELMMLALLIKKTLRQTRRAGREPMDANRSRTYQLDKGNKATRRNRR